MNIKNLLIISENALQNNLIKNQLNKIENIKIETSEVSELSKQNNIDLVIIDFNACKELEQSEQLPDFDVLNLGVLVFNVPEHNQNDMCIRWKSLKGLLLEEAKIEHLPESVECILNGGLWLPRDCLERMINIYRIPGCSSHQCLEQLTNRERQILNLMSSGSSNCEIAKTLFLAESTVKTHIYKIYKKLDVHKRRDAVKLMKLVRA